MKRAMAVLALAGAVALPARAEQDPKYFEEKAFLTLGAFECSVMATDESEIERLFLLGYEVGKEFINFVRQDPDRYSQTIKTRVPLLWNLYGGPSPDFILGQIYADRVNSIYDDHWNSDQEVWRSTRERLYEERNCRLPGK